MNARLKTPLAIIVTALLLLAPAIANGFPLLFYDTMHYYAGGQKLVSLLTDALPAPAADAPLAPEAAAPQAPAPAAQVSPSDRESGRGLMSYMGGRSPYYSAPLYILTQLFTAWAPAFLQALLGAWLIYLSCKAFGLGLRAFIAISLGAAALTALPWMASFLMPDVFGGYAILAAGLLIFSRHTFSTWEKRFLLLLLIAAAAFHTINLLLMIAALPLAALILLLQKQRPLAIARALTPLAAAIPLAIAAMLIYPAAAKIALGKPLPQPPFLMARMLADGPGRTYLYDACAKGERYTLCDFQQLPLNHADTILWSTDPKSGVYRASSWEAQLKLVAEQPRFVIGVVTHQFIPQVKASWWNWRVQLRSFGVNGLPTDAAGWREAADAGALAEPFRPFLHTPVGQNLWTLALLTRLHTIAFVAALALIAFGWTQRTIRESDAGRLFVTLTLFVLTLIVLNAGIAGALSGPFPRYQARVVWLMPLLAALAASHFVVQAQAAPKASAPAG